MSSRERSREGRGLVTSESPEGPGNPRSSYWGGGGFWGVPFSTTSPRREVDSEGLQTGPYKTTGTGGGSEDRVPVPRRL